jgi:hypothetical protein
MTIATYQQLADEYDDPLHSTTRALEELSNAAFRAAQPLRSSDGTAAVLELGAGTGALTRAIVTDHRWRSLIVTDPVEAMCSQVRLHVGRRHDVETHRYDAAGALHAFGSRVSVVLAGLADPFVNSGFIASACAAMSAGGALFVTVPSRRWAQAEREHRLGVPIESTRFRLSDGTSLDAASFTYDAAGLTALVFQGGFSIIDSGTQTSEHPIHEAHPEVAWVLAKRAA